MQDTHRQSVLFPQLCDRDIVVVADDPTTSSDGGALFLRAADIRLDLIDSLSACITDPRQSGKVDHTVAEMLRQRIIGIACGYEDANDAARLMHDPIHAIVVRGNPSDDRALASQPTLSRLENMIDTETNASLALTFMQRVIKAQRDRLRGRARHIMIDFDSTVDPTHGEQQLSLFNAFYDTWCYQTLLGFVRFDDEQEQHLVSATLLPGTGSMTQPGIDRLTWLIPMLRTYFPNARICVRMDAGFASPEMLDAFALYGVDFVLAMAQNAVLERAAEPYMVCARALAKARGVTSRVYTDTRYQAKSWKREYRVVIKAEVVAHEDRDHKDNARYVITNLKQSPHHIYANVYSQRGDIENRIKELKNDLAIDRTSCTEYDANCFRVLMTAAAYALLQEVRRGARGTSLATAQVNRLRLAIIKVAARVVASVRRIVVHLPSTMPHEQHWRLIARRLGAATG